MCEEWQLLIVCWSTDAFNICWPPHKGFPSGASGKESAYQCRRRRRHEFNPWVGRIPWRRAWQPTPVFLPWESLWTEKPIGLPWIECLLQLMFNFVLYRSSFSLRLLSRECVISSVLSPHNKSLKRWTSLTVLRRTSITALGWTSVTALCYSSVLFRK